MPKTSTIVGFLLAFLVLGVAFGSELFPRTTTQTVTANSSLTTVTATVMTVLVQPVVATCTEVSGSRLVVFVYPQGGESTTVTTSYPPSLPNEYQVSLTTITSVTSSNTTSVTPIVC